jgi:hypothetical protein
VGVTELFFLLRNELNTTDLTKTFDNRLKLQINKFF